MTAAAPGSESISPDTLSLLVRRFYAKAREDSLLGPVFAAAIDEWEPHLEQITAFWTTAILGTKTYRGNPLALHRRHPITAEMFDRWLALWGETADELFEPAAAAELRARAERIGESLKLGLFFDPTALTPGVSA